MKTPIADQDSKIDIIEHINQDHRDEILMIVQTYAKSPTATSAYLHDIFEEGIEINTNFSSDNKKLLYVPFQMQGETEEKLLYLAYSAMAKQGQSLSDNRRQFFSILDSYLLTPNLLRLTVASDTPLPENSPAYAYGFLLKILEKQPENKATSEDKTKNHLQRFTDSTMLWVMKKLSSKNRQKMLKSMNKGIRYYTLQSTWKSEPTKAFADRAYVDIFLHGDTAGSLWAKSLNIGDVIMSRVEHEDKHENLATGQALLIADETAYPALLGFLQTWKNPKAPYVIILSEKTAEQDYFSDETLKRVAKIQRIICPASEQGNRVIEALPQFANVTTVWGAFEKASTKAVRMHLRNELNIKGHDNRVKAYWVMETKSDS